MESENQRGYLIVGHGTRHPVGRDQMRQVFDQMTCPAVRGSLADKPAEYAFLELAEPGIPVAMQRLRDRGVREIVVIPVLLFSAGHATADIPGEVALGAERLGMRVCDQSRALCCDPGLIGLSSQRFRDALRAASPEKEIPLDQVALAMIGRGSSSPTATAAMLRFAELRQLETPVSWSTTGFIHAQRPSVDEALDGMAAAGLPWLVVQPHLLFEGQLMEDLRADVQYRQSFSTDQRWIITETLGPAEIVAQSLCRLASSCQVDSGATNCKRCGGAQQYC